MKFIIDYIKRYRVTYISVVLIFIIGIIIGICVTFKIPQNDKQEIEEYVKTSVTNIKENNTDKQEIFKNSLINNLKFIGIVWILGCTVIASFTIYILMVYKGFVFGYIITIIISIFGTKEGMNILFPMLILQNAIFLPMIFLLATSGIRMYKSILQREINIKIELLRHCILMLISIIFAIIISCIEAYFGGVLINIL